MAAPGIDKPTPHASHASSAALADGRVGRIALIGNPNTGKTSLFNRLCGVRSRTANFPGSTVDVRLGTIRSDDGQVEIADLPGIYGLNLNMPESRV